MASEKEEFITKQYIPTGDPLVQNDHTLIYKVRCMTEPGRPEGILKMYRNTNARKLYERLMQLDYSQWPHIYNVKYFDDSTLVVEEFLAGHTLQELMDRHRKNGSSFSEEEVGDIMEKICQNVQDLATLNPPLIHHNLKPSNIFVTRGGAVKFLDFVPGQVKNGLGQRHLIQSLGILFFELVTGHKPKSGIACTGRYSKIIKKCLSKDSNKGYKDLKEVNEDISYAKEHEPEETETVTIGIPYTLTLPFQGTILSFEWILFYYFLQQNSQSSYIFFGVIFFGHLIAYIAKRHTYLSKCGAYLSPGRRFLPFLALGGIFLILAYLIESFLLNH
ncbi:MAG: hypothetical protein K6G62_01900 [Eubacterium sp.]|nr:hypothetical protein [Eubacterium sp.]